MRSMRACCLCVLALQSVMFQLAAVGAMAPEPSLSSQCPPRPARALYSSKTAYELVRGKNLAPADSLQGCRAVNLWHLVRHGTRSPQVDEIADMCEGLPDLRERIQSNWARGKGTLCAADVERLQAWTPRGCHDEGHAMTEQGDRDMTGIGERLKQHLPDFFASKNPSDFEFHSTVEKRTQASARSYGQSLFDNSSNLPETIDNDPLLKFYSGIKVSKKKAVPPEVAAFDNGPDVKEALGRVSARLGFEDILPYATVTMMWNACWYDTAWDVEKSREGGAWCAAFEDEDLHVFAYRADLLYYYLGGYGSPLRFKLSCPLVKDIIEKFSSVEEGKQQHAGTIYFVHSKAFHATLTLLGLGRDAEQLTASNYESMQNRQWDISHLGPFGANLAMVLYQCPSGEKYRVRMLLNETPIQIAGCSDADALCSWNDFKQRSASVDEGNEAETSSHL